MRSMFLSAIALLLASVVANAALLRERRSIIGNRDTGATKIEPKVFILSAVSCYSSAPAFANFTH